LHILKKLALEISRSILKGNPDLAPKIESLARSAQGLNENDTHFFLGLFKELLEDSKAHLRQDIFVLFELQFKRNGYFVEFGAANGVRSSNTYLLEKQFGWTGILSEPARIFHDHLRESRRARIDTRCVWKESGKLIEFLECSEPELSTVEQFSSADMHVNARQDGQTYMVETVSLMDLLAHNNAPLEIDYLSIDTEGTELDILSEFDFSKYTISVVTCEHNYSPRRDKLASLFAKNGYERKFQNISKFDDWFVKLS
jgi:FkbM family methyltransferase